MKLRLLSWGGGAAAICALLATHPPAFAEPALPASDGAAKPVPMSTHPLASEFEAELRRDPELLEVYNSRDFAPVWIDGSGQTNAAAAALLLAAREAGTHALPGPRYRPEKLESLVAQPWSVAADIELTRIFLQYGKDLSSGVLVPQSVDRSIHVYPERPDPVALVAGLSASPDARAYLAGLAPAGQDYASLRARFQQLRDLPDGAWGPLVSSGRSLHEGDRNSRVGLLRERLTALGEYGAASSAPVAGESALLATSSDLTFDSGSDRSAPADPWVFDSGLAEAVRSFQARHGLNVDGVVGPATLSALNVTPGERAEQIAVNLERMRWLNRDLGRRHVMVNIAGFHMALIEDGRAIFESRVVVGKPRHATPEFSDEMEHMVVNPTWHVPYSIATKEILPKLQEDPTYLSRKNMRLVGSEIDPEFIDWELVTPSTFPGRIKQSPGGGNALGRVKFMFPNDFSIYLHDTPERRLFARDMRAYSHGCVRVEKPLEFAHLLLSAQESDPEGTFERWLNSGRELYVNLDEHLPVHLTYRTAWVDEAGRDQFRSDIYRRDERVMDALLAAGVSPFTN